MDFWKIFVESPALQALAINGVGQLVRTVIAEINKKTPADGTPLKAWLHPIYIVLSLLATGVDQLDTKGQLEVDPAGLQGWLNVYANTLMIHFGGKAIVDKTKAVTAKPDAKK